MLWVGLHSLKKHNEVLTSSTCERDLINQLLADDRVKMRWLGWSLIKYDLIKRGNANRQTYTQGRRPVKMKAETGVICLHAREHQRSPTNHQRVGKHGTPTLFLRSQQSAPLLPWPRVPGLRNCETGTFCYSIHSSVVPCDCSPRKLISHSYLREKKKRHRDRWVHRKVWTVSGI